MPPTHDPAEENKRPSGARISRRSALVWMAAGASAIAALGVSLSWRRRRRELDHELQDGLARLLSGNDAAAPIGQAYLALAPAEANADVLCRHLLDDLGGLFGLRTADGLLPRVQERVRQDFARGRTVTLAGWLLSRTELRLCALAFLSHPGGHTSRHG